MLQALRLPLIGKAQALQPELRARQVDSKWQSGLEASGLSHAPMRWHSFHFIKMVPDFTSFWGLGPRGRVWASGVLSRRASSASSVSSAAASVVGRFQQRKPTALATYWPALTL